MINVYKIMTSVFLLLILLSPTMAAPLNKVNGVQDLSIINPGLLTDDFARTRAFVKDFADHVKSSDRAYVVMTVTSISSKYPTWSSDDPNNPVGAVTYAQGTLNKVTPYLGKKNSDSYFIDNEIRPKFDQYFSNRLWGRNDFNTCQSSTNSNDQILINPTQYPFSPVATGKIDLDIYSLNTSTSKVVGAHVGSEKVNLTEEHGVLIGYGQSNPSTMYMITLHKEKNDIVR